jgi:hypothetical protein
VLTSAPQKSGHTESGIVVRVRLGSDSRQSFQGSRIVSIIFSIALGFEIGVGSRSLLCYRFATEGGCRRAIPPDIHPAECRKISARLKASHECICCARFDRPLDADQAMHILEEDKVSWHTITMFRVRESAFRWRMVSWCC